MRLSAGTGKLCIFGHLGLVFIWSSFVSCLLLLLYYEICAPVLTEGTGFFWYSKESEDSWPRSSANYVQPNLGSEIRNVIFWGLIFDSGINFGFVGIFWVLTFAPIPSSPSLVF